MAFKHGLGTKRKTLERTSSRKNFVGFFFFAQRKEKVSSGEGPVRLFFMASPIICTFIRMRIDVGDFPPGKKKKKTFNLPCFVLCFVFQGLKDCKVMVSSKEEFEIAAQKNGVS